MALLVNNSLSGAASSWPHEMHKINISILKALFFADIRISYQLDPK